MQLAPVIKVVLKTTATAFEEEKPTALKMEATEEFGYCTEFIMRIGGENNARSKRFLNVLNSHGN